MPDKDAIAALFKFQYLPGYAKFILEKKLEEFVVVGIRFCRELDLPMMRPLSRFTEHQLTELSREGNREMLTSLSNNEIYPLIERNIDIFVNNQIKDSMGNTLLDKSEVLLEDIILGMYIRRKLFAFFLHSYTPNSVLHVQILAELDYYTTQEQLLTMKAMAQQRQSGEQPLKTIRKS